MWLRLFLCVLARPQLPAGLACRPQVRVLFKFLFGSLRRCCCWLPSAGLVVGRESVPRSPVWASVSGRRGRPASLGIASVLALLLGQAKSAWSLRQGRAFLSGRRNFLVSQGLCFSFFSSGWVPMPWAGDGEASTPGRASLPPCWGPLCTRAFCLSSSLQERTPFVVLLSEAMNLWPFGIKKAVGPSLATKDGYFTGKKVPRKVEVVSRRGPLKAGGGSPWSPALSPRLMSTSAAGAPVGSLRAGAPAYSQRPDNWLLKTC